VNTLYILSVVFTGCEAWSLELGEEHRLTVFENMVLRLYGLKLEQATRITSTLMLSIFA